MVIGDRMKEYEKAYTIVLPKRLPMIIRIDGKAFHKLLGGIEEPFDTGVKHLLDAAAGKLLEEISGAVFAYLQSDEINVLVVNYSSLDFCPWFGNEIQKISSVSASIATAEFNRIKEREQTSSLPQSVHKITGDGYFDARCFILPKEEVCNYYIWRQQDWTRNSMQMLARTFYSQKEIHLKKNKELQEMIFRKGMNWNDLEIWKRRGRCITKNDGIHVDDEPPIFTQNRKYVEKHVCPISDEKDQTPHISGTVPTFPLSTISGKS
ncbi:MAG: tRNA(His) guanylyltransferase Thg1 family protein [Candidatus Altiarchaeota archaeon]